MSKIDYRTRGGASPQGKPRVYFCSHPQDHSRFFEEIVADIFKTQNCAVYFETEYDATFDSEELLSDLSQMQLFVIPVTGRFLTSESRARDLELRFAEEHHIPVLPLLQENGSVIMELFGKVFGDRQYLDKSARDDTAISFDEKLEKFLSSILVGDEMAEKVRAAFDAYIFLSYRKKDRKYAKELMRLIHKNEFCRDIAIWYDEYLTPGEDFNDEIEKAFEKSSLFALAVTPNLLEDDNYIIRCEYPMAKKSGKGILPAEMVPADRDELKRKYEDIPEVTDARDEGTLSSALMEKLSAIAKRENDNDPQHNFFIGLAYLSGIDVEVDHERALSLITASAEAGVEEAIEKLVAMYRNGEGVERNYETAVEWQRKLVAMRKANFDASGEEWDGYRYISTLWSLGDYIYELRQIDEAESVYAEMLSFSKLLNEKYDNNRSKRYISVSYDKIGDIAKSRGKLDEAEKYYISSLEIRKKTTEETGTVQSSRDLSISYERMGIIAESRGKLDEAEKYYISSLEIRKKISEETGTVEACSALYFSYNRMGFIAQARGKLDEAEKYYISGLEIAEKIVNETGTVESRRDLSASYEVMGYIAEKRGKLDEAEKYYISSLEIRKKITEETGTVQSRRDLSIKSEAKRS